MNGNLAEAIEAVLTINDALETEAGHEQEWHILELMTDGNNYIIDFMGAHIYNSNDESGRYDEKHGKTMPIEPYLRKLINQERDDVRKTGNL